MSTGSVEDSRPLRRRKPGQGRDRLGEALYPHPRWHGHVENVAGHWRSAPPGHGGEPGAGRSSDKGDGDIILAAKRPDPPWQQPTISEGGLARAGGGGGRASGRTDPRPSGGRASRPLPSDLEEVLRPLDEGSTPHSNPEVRNRPGGLAQRQADFERIVAPGTARPGSEPGQAFGQTRSGHLVTVRESDSGPTLEVSHPRSVKTGSRTIRKYRYGAQ